MASYLNSFKHSQKNYQFSLTFIKFSMDYTSKFICDDTTTTMPKQKSPREKKSYKLISLINIDEIIVNKILFPAWQDIHIGTMVALVSWR